MSARRILVAGIGNVFLGDDGFGVAVVRRLGDDPWPDGVDVVDYGIRGVHLAYDLLDGRYDTLVLVDALPLGEPPGTIGVIEVDLNDPQWTLGPEAGSPDAHGMDPSSTLRLVTTLGGALPRVLVVGCQPETLDEGMRLSAAVEAAVEPARALVIRVVREQLVGEHPAVQNADAGGGTGEEVRSDA
jgi:hydrogenase maturation protease